MDSTNNKTCKENYTEKIDKSHISKIDIDCKNERIIIPMELITSGLVKIVISKTNK